MDSCFNVVNVHAWTFITVYFCLFYAHAERSGRERLNAAAQRELSTTEVSTHSS